MCLVGATVLATGTSSSALAAGFDCAKASSSVEKTICADPSLLARDGTLTRFYGWALGDAAVVDKPKLIAEQKNWISQTRDVCTTPDCLGQAYDARIEQFLTIKIDGGGSASYVSDAAEAARITKEIEQDLRKVGITAPLGACSHILALDDKSSSHGAFCNLGNQKGVAVCDEDMFGNLAVKFYGFEQSGPGLAAFTQAACTGG